MCKRFLVFFLLLLLFLIVFSGCNMPGGTDSPTEVIPPDAVATAAAETIEAQLSPTVVIPQSEEPTSTFTPAVLEPTSTLEPTETSTPTEAPTPTEIPEVIFFDDFSDQTSWYTFEDDRYGFRYTAAGYHIENNIPNGLIWSIREQNFMHIALEVDGTRLSGPADSYFGVVCNFSDEGDNYYALVIGDDGFYGLGLMEDSEFEFLESGMDQEDIINQGLGETNRIRGLCNGGHFSIHANGELLLDTWDDTLEEGIIGIVVGNKRSGDGTEFRFNDFALIWP